MKPFKFFIYVFTGFTISVANIFSQEAVNALTWEDCLKEAQKNNPDLSIAREDYQKNIYLYRQAFSNFYPSANLTGSYRNGTQSASGLYSPNAQNQYSVGVSLTENIFNGLADKSAVDKSYALMKVSELDLFSAKVQLSYDLKNTFTQVVYFSQLVELTALITKQRKLNVDTVRLNFEAGTEHKGSYLLSEAYYHQSVVAQTQAGRNLKASLAALSRIMGRNEIIDTSVKGDFPIYALAKEDIFKIITEHPQYKQDQEKMNAAKAAIMITDGAFFPSLNLNASFSAFDNKFFPQNQSWYLGGSISYPLFSFAQNFYTSKMVRQDFEKSKIQIRSRYNQLMADIETAYENAVIAVENVGIQEEFLNAAELRARIARVQYANGLLVFENWDLIESALITAEQNLLSAKLSAALAETNFEKVSGRSMVP